MDLANYVNGLLQNLSYDDIFNLAILLAGGKTLLTRIQDQIRVELVLLQKIMELQQLSIKNQHLIFQKLKINGNYDSSSIVQDSLDKIMSDK